jgi:peptidoglycan/LPS O-acetylase OafA/YrhL
MASSQKPETGRVRGSADFNKNNLDCLRLILASIVAFFHCYALSNIPALSPLGRYLSPHFAVKGFFVISGMLIYRSYIRSSSIRSYLEKRVRRIYPAYFTIIALAALLLPLTSASFPAHSFGFGYWKYIAANLVFLNFLAPNLPGVFTANSLSGVNGALWTLKIEVAFYLFVPVIHFFCRRYGTKLVIGILMVLSSIWKYGFIFLAAAHPDHPLYAKMDVQFPAQLVYFLAGIVLLTAFDHLKHYFLAISVLAISLYLVDHFFTGEKLDLLWISGVVFAFGFWHYLGNFSKYGDFSYGVYIVHWPILQTLISFRLADKLPPLAFLALSLFLIFLAALLMWHLVEKRFLATSSHYRQANASAAPTANS